MSQTNILVMGATGGIGRTLCEQLVNAGHHLFLSSRQASPLQALASDLSQPYFTADASNNDEVVNLFTHCMQTYTTLDGVVNLAGSVLLKPLHLLRDDEWQHTIQTNLTTAFLICREATKHMMKTGGSVVLMSTAAASIGIANHEAICAAKKGVEGLMRAAAATYASYRLRFNCVAPGLTKTALTQHLISNPKSESYSQKMHPLGRLGTPNDIANIIAFLLDRDNDWITGQVIAVDGGLSSIKT